MSTHRMTLTRDGAKLSSDLKLTATNTNGHVCRGMTVDELSLSLTSSLSFSKQGYSECSR